MATHRCLVQAVVVGVNDGSVLYPACLQCYAKMLHDLHTDVWQCLRCQLRCRGSELSWRYRLSLCVADTSATCHLSLFGGTLVPHFGCSADTFHQFLHTTTTTTTDMNAVDEDLILQAVQTTLVGNRYIFCLKTSALPQRSTSTTAHPAPVSTHPAISRPLCLADLMSGVPVSQRSGEKLSDFVAVQMIPVGTVSIANSPTVLSVLKGLVCRHPESSSHAERQGEHMSGQEPRKEGRDSPGKSELGTQSFTSSCSYKMGVSGCRKEEEHVHSVSDDDGGDSSDPWSQSSGNGQAMLRFSCQSSMDQAFPSSSGCSAAGYMAADSSCRRENPNCAGETSKEIEALIDGFDTSQYSDVSCSQTALALAAEDHCDSSHLSGQDPQCYTKNFHERKFSSSLQKNGDNTNVLVFNYDNCDISTVNHPSVDRLNTANVFQKVSVMNKTRAEDETVLDSQTTLASLAWFDNNRSMERSVCEERACQPQDTDSQHQMAETQAQSTSFSSSLNDSSLLLAAVHVNPHLEPSITHDQSSWESIVRDREETLEQSSLKQSGAVTVCRYVSKDEEGRELGQERAVSRRLDSVEDMPFSEDLSMFLQIMGDDPTSVGSTSPWTALDGHQHQQHMVVSTDHGAELQEHCIDNQTEDSKIQQKGLDIYSHKEHTSLQQKGQDTHNQKEHIRTQKRQDTNSKKTFTSSQPKQQDLYNQTRFTRTQETKQYSYRRKRYHRTRKKGQETVQDRVFDTAVHEVHNKSLRRQKTLAEKQHGIVETGNGDATHLKGCSMTQRGPHITEQQRTHSNTKCHRRHSTVQPKRQNTGHYEIHRTFCDTSKLKKTKEFGRACEVKTTTSQNIIQVPSVHAAKFNGLTEEHKLQSCNCEESVCMTQPTTQSPLSDSTVSVYRSRAERCGEHDVRPTDSLASLMGNIDTCTINDTNENGLTSVVGDVNTGQMNDATRICPPCPPETLKNTSTENGSCERNLMSPTKKLNMQGTYDGKRTVPASPVEKSGISAVKDREINHLKTAVKKAGVSSISSSQSLLSNSTVTDLPYRETPRKVSRELSPEDLFEDSTLSFSLLEETGSFETIHPVNLSAMSRSIQKCEKCQNCGESLQQTCICETEKGSPSKRSKKPSYVHRQDTGSLTSERSRVRKNYEKIPIQIQLQKSSEKHQQKSRFHKNPHRQSAHKNRRRTSSCKNPDRNGSPKDADSLVCSFKHLNRGSSSSDHDKISSYRGINRSGSLVAWHRISLPLHRDPTNPKSHQDSRSSGPEEFLQQHGADTCLSGSDHSAVVMPDSENLDAFLNNLVHSNVQPTENTTSAENCDRGNTVYQKIQRNIASPSAAGQITGSAYSKKKVVKRKRSSLPKQNRRSSLHKNTVSDDAFVGSSSQTDNDFLDCSADLFSQNRDDEMSSEECARTIDRSERLPSSQSSVSDKMSQPCIYKTSGEHCDSLKTIEETASSIDSTSGSENEKSDINTSQSSEKAVAQEHKILSTVPQEQRKVRFARKRRISSVRDIDFRLERYTSPKEESQNRWQQQTVHLTPRRSCLKQCMIPPSLHSDAPEKTITKSTVSRDFRLPLVETQNVGGSSYSSCMQMKDAPNSSCIQKEHCTPFKQNHKSGEFVSVLQETSGSQDLFSQCSSQEQGQLSAMTQATPEAQDVFRARINSAKTQRDTPDFYSDSPTNNHLSVFDSSDVLFDDSENVSEDDIVSRWTSAKCSPKHADTRGRETTGSVSLVNREATDVTRRKSGRLNSSSVWSSSPELFSP